MKIAVLGATGMVGSRITAEALARGHDLTAIARTTARRHTLPTGIELRAIEATDTPVLTEALHGVDAVVCALRPARGQEHTIAAATTAVLDATHRIGARVLVVGGAGPLTSPGTDGRLVVDDPRWVPPAWRDVAAASLAQLHACQPHPAHWVYLSPAAVLEPGDRTGVYRSGTTELLVAPDGTSRISAEDLAVAVLDELQTPTSGARHLTFGY